MYSRLGGNKLTHFIAVVALGLSLYGIFVGRSVPVASAQIADAYLSRRVDQVEQRFYQLESRLNRLESESMRSSVSAVPAHSQNDIEMQYLRTQTEGLRSRVGELECGVLRLDERTLPATRRMAKKSAEPCRKDPEAVVQLSARP
jgi:hypothetical protein